MTDAIVSCRPNLLVRDLNASLRFYAEALGFLVGWQWSDRHSRFLSEGERVDPGEPGTALVGRDQAQIMLTQVPGPHATRLHLDVRTSTQVDLLFEEWSAQAVPIAEPPTLRAWGMYEMRLLDPDGHMLRVSAPPSDHKD
jgi:catechol 2,3-dioxygenase-like lactoylglutathione lyase family enzyme